MKKTIALLLILCLLLGASAFAYFQFFSTPTPPEPFTLRNGYYWGMPKEEALSLAAEEGLTEIADGNSIVIIFDVPIDENYAATFTLYFNKDMLLRNMNYSISYKTEEEALHMLEYFAPTIETKYNVSREDWTIFSDSPGYVFYSSDVTIAIAIEPSNRHEEFKNSTRGSFYIGYQPGVPPEKRKKTETPTPTARPADYGI